jgi:hypothetical protein
MSLTKVCISCALSAGALLASGCSTIGVRPWERDLLSRSDMRFDAEGLDVKVDDHVYFSKEASSGGRSFAGGGCGCN